ncbi:Peptidyl-prolyl cis-trans isomerase D [Bienertia sinuspersici]
MADIKKFEELRGELSKMFVEEANFMNEDGFILNLLLNSLNPKEVLTIVRDVKKEGNAFFRSEKFDDALERYGYAKIILVKSKIEEEVDKIEMWNLTLCILQNISACFSRLNEFEQEGHICTTILVFQPKNVKAMYRRAMAAIGLGRHEWAYWDLKLAAKISPSNQEVIKRLEEVKNSIHNKKSNDHAQGDCPKGLGLSLPTYSKKTNKVLGKEKLNDPKDFQDRELSTVDKEGEGNHLARLSKGKECESSSKLEIISSDECKVTNDTSSSTVPKEKDKFEAKDEMVESSESQHSFTVLSSTNIGEKTNSSYRFHDRKRHKYSLSISKSNYLLMCQGKTLKFYNAKVGSFMEVRIVKELEEKDVNSSHDHRQEKLSPMQCEKQSEIAKEKHDNVDAKETHSEIGSCMTTEDKQLEYGDGDTSSPLMQPQFSFTTNPEIKAKKKKGDKIKWLGSCKLLRMFEVGKKRKWARLLPKDFHQYTKKRIAPHICQPSRCIACPSYCIITCNMLIVSPMKR